MIPVVPEVKVQSLQSLPAGELDCLSCRIVGTAAFSGISAYAYHLRSMAPKSEKGNRLFFLCFSLSAAAVAVTRFVT